VRYIQYIYRSQKEVLVRTRIAKWGHSLAVRIPKAFAQEIRLAEGAEVDLTVSESRLLITPVCRGYSLEQLVAGITAENRHSETEWGEAVGLEAW
jgi:antitoxin MazE